MSGKVLLLTAGLAVNACSSEKVGTTPGDSTVPAGDPAPPYEPRIVITLTDDREVPREFHTSDLNGNTELVVAAPTGRRFDESLVPPGTDYFVYMLETTTPDQFELWSSRLNGDDAAMVSPPLPNGASVEGGLQAASDGSRVLYYVDLDTVGLSEAYTIRPSGSDNVKVNGPLAVSSGYVGATFAQGGAKIAYTAEQTTSGVRDLSIVGADGSGAQKVSGTMSAGSAGVRRTAWAPDGSILLYTAAEDPFGQPAFYTVGADGAGKTRVSDAVSVIAWAVWAPNSQRFYYLTFGMGTRIELMTCAAGVAAGCAKVSGPMTTDGTGGNVNNPAWSPTSDRIAYTADQDTDEFPELYVSAADTAVGNTRVSQGRVLFFRWSPDGTRIAYCSDADANGINELFVVTVATSTSQLIFDTALSKILKFAWSPDGTRLAYVADPTTTGLFELYIASGFGSTVTHTKASGDLEVGDEINSIIWSPDGEALLYVSDEETRGTLEIYAVDADGGNWRKVSPPLSNGLEARYFSFL